MSAVKIKERKLKEERKQTKKELIPAKEERKIRRYENSLNHLQLDQNGEDDNKPGCSVPMIACCRKGDLVLDGIKMLCTNKNCDYAKKLVHPDCFLNLEVALLKILKTMGSARGWTDVQRRQNLWEKKGLNLIHKQIRCQCSMGIMSVDTDYKDAQKHKKSEEDGTPKIEKRKPKKKTKELPTLTFGKITATREEQLPINRKKVAELENHFLSCQDPDESFDETYTDKEEVLYSVQSTLSSKRETFPSSTAYGKPPENIWPKLATSYIKPSDNATPLRSAYRKSRMEISCTESQPIHRRRTNSFDHVRTPFTTPLHSGADSAFESPGTDWTTPISTRETSPNNEDFQPTNSKSQVAKVFAEKVAEAIAKERKFTDDNLVTKNNLSGSNKSSSNVSTSLNNILDVIDEQLLLPTSTSLSSKQTTSKNAAVKVSPAENRPVDSKTLQSISLTQKQLLFPPGLRVAENQTTSEPKKLSLSRSTSQYTLFGPDSPSFYLGEKLLGNLHFPGGAFPAAAYR